MSRTTEFISHLRVLGVQVSVEGERLRCSAPEGVLTTALRRELAERKGEIRAFLQQARQNRGCERLHIEPASREGSLPLSFAQQRLWFLDQLEPGNVAYNMPLALRVRGELDRGALRRALDELVSRHETLRTSFPAVEGRAEQRIAARLCIELPEEDLRGLEGEAREAAVDERLQANAREPFDLSVGPLFRARLLRTGEQEQVLLLCLHHIISDGWSTGVLHRELSALYGAFIEGKGSPLPELAVQYADFARWQREWLEGEVLEAQLGYWRERLAGMETLELPTDRLRPAVQTYNGSRVERLLSGSLSEGLNRLSRAEGATLFMTLLGAFAVLLGRYTGQEDIVVGSPIANRNRSEIEGLIGFFVNALVMRTDLSGEPSFRELLGRVREVALGAFTHQDLPFERLVEELRPERDLSRNPLLQVLFAVQNTPVGTLELGGLELERMGSGSSTTRFDLEVHVRERGPGLAVVFVYNPDLFEASTVERMAGHYERLLEGAVANPDLRVSELPILGEAERHRLLEEWNDTATEYPREQCIHRLFEAQVERTPEAVALEFEGERLTYRELNRRANQLAHYLQGLGVGPDVVVGLCAERSLEMVVGLLGVLKAGGAYVALDPAYPPKRLEFMLRDADAPVLLTQTRLRGLLGVHAGETLYLDEIDWAAEVPERALHREVSAQNLAYVIYTSGSTGEPKGVEMPHRALVNLMDWSRRQAGFASAARTLQFTTLSFDVSFQEIFTTWCSGGTLVLVAESVRRDPAQLGRYLAEHAIERLFLPCVVLEHLAAELNQRDLPGLRLAQIITAGERLRVTANVRRLIGRLGGCVLHNHYGPSETHVVTAHELSGSPVDWPDLPPIGRPIANTRAYVLDRRMQPVPIGAAGELFIGGFGLARGYRKRPELTRERFLPDPFSDRPGERLYRTGDRARWLVDGRIEFLGRTDRQVKVRGFRIEPGEIETVLATHPRVEEGLVLGRRTPDAQTQLVAYVVPDQRQVPTADELRGFLRERLPGYMVPSAFVPLEALPLTASGKVDRAALASLTASARLPEPDSVAPRTPTERKLAQIWKRVLWLDHDIGVHDDFFDLGGHSLLSIRLCGEIERAMDRALPVAALFRLSTVAELAEALDRDEVKPETDVEAVPSARALDPEILRALLAFTAGWRGRRVAPQALMVGLNTAGTRPALFWCLQGFRELAQLAKYLGEDQPTYGMRSGHLVMKYTPENIEALAAHYVEEILAVQPRGPYLLGGNCQAAGIALEIDRQLTARGEPVALLSLLESQLPDAIDTRVAFFYGRESRFNPNRTFRQPELGLRKRFRAGFSLDLVRGDHGQYFNEPNIQVFAERLGARIAEALAAPAAAASEESALCFPAEAYRARLGAPSALTARAGARLSVRVNVKNLSSVNWPATERSGIRLGNHWRGEAGEILCWGDGRADLPRDVPPGAALDLDLVVTVPQGPGRATLELDLVEEGITWFGDRGSEYTRVEVDIASEHASRDEAKDAQACRAMGDDAMKRGDYEAAIAGYQAAVRLEARQPAAVQGCLGAALARQSRWPEAIAAYELALALEPHSAALYFQLGSVHRRLGRLLEAVQAYRRALVEDPDSAFEVHHELGQALEQLKRYEEAVDAYQTAIRLQPENPYLHSDLARSLRRWGRHKESLACFETVLELNPDDVGARVSIAELLAAKGQRARALELFRSALELKPHSANLHFKLANYHRRQGELGLALECYRRVIALEIGLEGDGAHLEGVPRWRRMIPRWRRMEIALKSLLDR